jgi:hypothetical protein
MRLSKVAGAIFMRCHAMAVCFSILLGMFAASVSAAEGTPKRRQFSSPSGGVVLRVSTTEDTNTVTGTAVRIDGAGETVIWERPLAYMPERAFVSDAGEVIAVQKIELAQASYWQARAIENAVTAYNARASRRPPTRSQPSLNTRNCGIVFRERPRAAPKSSVGRTPGARRANLKLTTCTINC